MITKERLEQISRGTFTGDDGIKDIAQYLVEQAEKEAMKPRPRAKDREAYYYVDEFFGISQGIGSKWDNDYYNSGNYFLTREEARAFADKIKELRKTM